MISDDQLFDLQTTVIDRKPDRALESSQGGMRFKGIWRGIDFSLNYFFTFGDTGVKVRRDLASCSNRVHYRVRQCTVLNTVNARSHVVGFAANYSEEHYTQAVFRIETALSTGVPVSLQSGIPHRFDPDNNSFETAKRTVVMLAFDRPTWIHPLNPHSHVLSFRAIVLAPLSRLQPVLLLVSRRCAGPFLTVKLFRTGTSSVNTDKFNQDEFVMTLSASTSYGPGGLWQPLVVAGV